MPPPGNLGVLGPLRLVLTRSRRRIITYLSRVTTRILMIVCYVLCKLQHCYTDIVRLCLRLDQLCTALSKSNCSKGGPSIDIRMQWLSV